MKNIAMTIMPPSMEELLFCLDFQGWAPEEYPFSMRFFSDDAGPSFRLVPCDDGDGIRIEAVQVESAAREPGYCAPELYVLRR